jgi:hypothetical protein
VISNVSKEWYQEAVVRQRASFKGTHTNTLPKMSLHDSNYAFHKLNT